MALNIKNPKAHKLAEELAAVTGESLTTSVVKALEERLARVRQTRRKKSLAEELNEIGRRLSKCPVYDDRTLEEMLYDEQGLPK